MNRPHFAFATCGIGLAIFVAGCTGEVDERAGDDDSAVTASSEFLAEVLAKVAASPTPVMLPDEKTPAVLLGGVADGKGSYTLDLRPFLGNEASKRQVFGAFTFKVAEWDFGKKPNPTLGDPAFALAYGNAAQRSNHPQQPDEFKESVTSVNARRALCKGNKTAPIQLIFQDADFDGILDCHFFDKQDSSSKTLTSFELASLVMYTGNDFAGINKLLRARTFSEPNPASTNAAELKTLATDAVWAVGAISALNKLDKFTAQTYRGVESLHQSCEEKASGLAAEPAKGKVDEEISRFCGYFKTVKSYRDCGFGSASVNPNIALSFAKIGTTSAVPNQPGKIRLSNVAPTGPRSTPVVFQIKSRTGASIKDISAFPPEEEVLFRPGVNFNVGQTSPKIALTLVADANATIDYTKSFELVDCGKTLSADQKKRVSHFRVSLSE